MHRSSGSSSRIEYHACVQYVRYRAHHLCSCPAQARSFWVHSAVRFGLDHDWVQFMIGLQLRHPCIKRAKIHGEVVSQVLLAGLGLQGTNRPTCQSHSRYCMYILHVHPGPSPKAIATTYALCICLKLQASYAFWHRFTGLRNSQA